MRVGKIGLNQTISANNNSFDNKKAVSQPNRTVQTSIYNQKGLTIPFGCTIKGADEIEEGCIKLLRKVREFRRRKFGEDDIKDIIIDLRGVKNQDSRRDILEEVLTIEDESTGSVPNKGFIRKVIQLVSDKTQGERSAVLEYAQNEIKKVNNPLEIVMKLPKDAKDKWVQLLTAIDKVNEHKLFKSQEAQIDTIDSLYELARVPLYAYEDLSNLANKDANAYKVEAIGLLNHDKKWFYNLEGYANRHAKDEVMSVTNKVYNYFMNAFIN